jgi:hypothetical protein
LDFSCSGFTRSQDGFQRGHEGADDPGRAEGTDESVTGQAGALHRVRGHHAHQGRVRDVDHRVRQHHQRVGDIGVNQLARIGKLGAGEHRVPEHSVRNGAPKKIGAELAPTRIRAVSDQAHHRVADGIDHLGNHEHDANQRGIEAEHIRVVVQQEDIEDLEKEIGRCVAQAVAQFLLEGKPESGIVSGLFVFGHHMDSGWVRGARAVATG